VTASRKMGDTEDECEVAMERLRESIERFEAMSRTRSETPGDSFTR